MRRAGGAVALRPDLMQEGTIALIRAVDQFEGQSDADFLGYARRRIDRRLKHALRRRARERGCQVDLPLETLEDLRGADPHSMASDAETERQAEALLRTLSKAEQRVLRLRFGIGTHEPQTLDAIAESLGIRPSRACFLEERALSALRRAAHRMRKTFSP